MAYGPFFLPDLSYPFTCPCTCVSTYRPFTGPCTSVCLVRVFAQFSMARVRFRPRRASATFFPCPRTARSRVRVCVCLVRGFAQVSMCARHVPSTTGVGHFLPVSTYSPFTPVFHGAHPLPSTTGVGHFFPVSTYSPFTGPCTCVCVVRVFAQFSMACVRFRPRRASPTFFPCPRTARSRVRVTVRVRACASYVVLPSFP